MVIFMSNEYEFIFEQLSNYQRSLNFKEYAEYGEVKKSSKMSYNKIKVNYNRPSGKITEYSITKFDYHTNEKILLVNYQADAAPFNPESEKYYEPTWLDFTDIQLKKALSFLTEQLEMKMNTNREHYKMLVFKDKFHLSIRVPNLDTFEELEHNLCITGYINVSE